MTEQEKERGRFWRAAWFLPLLFLLSAGWSLYPAEQRGADVRVWTVDDVKYEGELLKVSDTGLLLFNHEMKREIQLELDKIDYLETIRTKIDPATNLLNAVGAGLLGGILINSSEKDDRAVPYPEATDQMLDVIIDSAVIGLSTWIGSIGNKLLPVKPHIFRNGKNDSDREKFLNSLQPYSRENYDPARQKKGFLGRFRISWRPFFRPPGHDMCFAGQYKSSANSVNWDHFSFPQEHFHPYPCHRSLHFQLDYSPTYWLSTGLDLISLGQYDFYHEIYDGYSVKRNFYIRNLIVGELGIKAALLSINFTPPNRKKMSSGFQVELGIGPAFSNFKFDSWCFINNVGTHFSTSTSWTTLAYKIGLSQEFTPGSSLSLGLYCNYLSIPATFPGVELSVPNPFTIENGFEHMPMQILRQQFNFGRLIIGALLRFR